MFDSADGLFHFVFADPDDNYYNDKLMQLDLEAYLWYELAVAYDDISALGCEDGRYWIDEVYDRKPGQENSQNGVLGLFSFFGNKKNTDNAAQTESSGDIHRMERGRTFFDGGQLVRKAQELLETSDAQESSAVLLSADIFFRLLEIPEIEQKLEQMAAGRRRRRGTVIVIVFPMNPELTNKYFMLPNGAMGTERTGVFAYPGLFPEICDRFRDTNMHKLVFTYKELYSCLNSQGHRMTVLGDFAVDRVAAACDYFYLRNPGERVGDTEKYSSFLSGWFRSRRFRRRCGELGFPEIKLRKYKDIPMILSNEEIVSLIDGTDINALLDKCRADVIAGQASIYSRKRSDLQQLAEELLETVLRRDGFSEDDRCAAEAFIDRLSLPSQDSPRIMDYLPHTVLESDDRNYNTIKNMVRMVDGRESLCGWDIYAVKIYIAVMRMCSREMDKSCIDADIYNSVSLAKLRRGIEAIDYMIVRSSTSPEEPEEAGRIYEDYCSLGDNTEEIRNWVIKRVRIRYE